jgi:hypothetical protein
MYKLGAVSSYHDSKQDFLRKYVAAKTKRKEASEQLHNV